jgi:hypothetical protein
MSTRPRRRWIEIGADGGAAQRAAGYKMKSRKLFSKQTLTTCIGVPMTGGGCACAALRERLIVLTVILTCEVFTFGTGDRNRHSRGAASDRVPPSLRTLNLGITI